MTGRFFAALLMIPTIIFCMGLNCLASQEVVEFTTNGSINWTRGILNASGISAPAKKNPGGSLNSQNALASAKIAAYQNLLKVAQSVRVDNTLTVNDFTQKNTAVMEKLKHIATHAAIIDQKYSTSGTAEVAFEINLLGGFSQLFLPAEIEAVQSIQPVKPNPDRHTEAYRKTAAKKEIYSGFIVDARGIGIQPVMAPKILDESRQEIYGPAFVSREIAVQEGICRYETDLASAQGHRKAGGNPLVVKALRTMGVQETDVVICNADALKIRSASEHLEALKHCNVIIVMDPPRPFDPPPL